MCLSNPASHAVIQVSVRELSGFQTGKKEVSPKYHRTRSGASYGPLQARNQGKNQGGQALPIAGPPVCIGLDLGKVKGGNGSMHNPRCKLRSSKGGATGLSHAALLRCRVSSPKVNRQCNVRSKGPLMPVNGPSLLRAPGNRR
jgi:hypothetical protein